MTFLISVLLAVGAVVIRYLVYTGVQMPPDTDGQGDPIRIDLPKGT
jgi:hypothetical protein